MFGLLRARVRTEIDPGLPFVAGPKVSVAERDERAVLMDLRSGRYFGLDEVGTRIWQLLLEKKTLMEMFAVIESEYDVPPEQLRNDTTHFLESLLSLGLVRQ